MLNPNFLLSRLLFAGLCMLCLKASSLENTRFEEKNAYGPRVEQVRIRHIEPNGLGYRDGYSSLDLFLTLPRVQSPYLPFLDLRGHVFDDGKWAANAGTGLRYLSTRLAHVFGANFFYDYRSSSKRHYNQISMGVEALGRRWDFRANGYVIVGGKQSKPFDFEFDLETFFLTAKREYPMSGADAEAGYHFPKIKHAADVYLAAGPYFYTSRKADKNTTGGRLRAMITLFTYINVEGIVSYDPLFRWIGQGAVALNFPFGSRKQLSPDAGLLQERLFQQVQHNEIIVIKKHRKKL